MKKRLGEYVTFQRGFDLPEPKRNPGNIPVISSGGITGFHNETPVTGPGVVTARYGSVGNVFFIKEDYWPLNTTLWVKDFHGHDPQFIYQMLKTLDFSKFSNKTGVPGVNRNDLHKSIINVADILDEEKIVALCNSWDSAIEKTERLIVFAELRKSAIMQRLFKGSVRGRSHQTGWKEYHLGQLFSERLDANHPELPLLSITGNDGVVDRESTGRKDSSSEDKSNYLRICPGDIGYNTMRMWQGVSALSTLEGIVSPAYTIVTPRPQIRGDYASFLFKYPPMVNEFYRYSQGLTSDTWNLKFDNFAEIAICIPSVQYQAKAARIVEAVTKEIALLKNLAKAYSDQKSYLMSKLLTGEWVAPELGAKEK